MRDTGAVRPPTSEPPLMPPAAPRAVPTLYHLRHGRFRGAHDLARVPGMRLLPAPADLTRADAVVVHLPGILAANDPAELVRLRRIAPPGQVWVAESMESAALYPVLDDPDFMALFDLEMTYRQAADIWTPYLPRDFAARIAPPPRRPRRRLCCAFVSSEFDESGRREFMRELMAHMEVHSYGRYLRTRRLLIDRGRPTKLKTLGKYRYTLAFENSVAPDYVTEKLYEPLLTGTVPVYLGAPNVAEFAPGPDSYVDARAFASPAELARYLRETDPARHHAWRTAPLAAGFAAKLDRLRKGWEVELAEKVRARRSKI
jgi:alpha-1,3-fucosyltransferase 10